MILALDLSTKSNFIKEEIINKRQLEKYNNKYVVYMLIFPNNKKYCGYSSNIKRRWRNKNEYNKQKLIFRAIEKYGWENIKKEIWYCFDNMRDALNKESELIEQLHLTNHNYGYNMVAGGNEPPHLSKYEYSPEGYKKLQENGKRLAEYTWKNQENRKYAIQRMKEETHKKRMLLSKNELKEKYGKSNIGKLPPNAKSILQIDLQTKEIIAEFPSARQAAIIVVGNPEAGSNIQRTARGIGNGAYGYGWRWK